MRLSAQLKRFTTVLWGLGVPLYCLAQDPNQSLRTFSETVERDVVLKEQVPISILHPKGQVSIQGWVQDRVRVVLKKKIITTDQETAQAAFLQKDLFSIQTPHSLELRVGRAHGQDLITKLKAQRDDRVEVDLEIRAPFQSVLHFSGGEQQEITVAEWKGALTLSSKNSTIAINKCLMKGDLKISCPSCQVSISDSEVQGTIYATQNPVLIRKTLLKKFSIETTQGEVVLENTQGKVLVATESGRIYAKTHTGELQAQSKLGGIFIDQYSGSGQWITEGGQIIAQVKSLKDSLMVESEKGEIQIELSPRFQGLLDLSSLKGSVLVQFPHQPISKNQKTIYGPQEPGLIYSKVGSVLTPVLRAKTNQAGIRILRGKFE